MTRTKLLLAALVLGMTSAAALAASASAPAVPVPPAEPETAVPEAIAPDPVDGIVREQLAVSHLPGAAVAIVDHGKVVKLAAYGSANLEWDTPVDPDTRFQLASATKLFTAVSLMRLVEHGQLKLDQPLSDFFPDAPPSWQGITVRMLANHTSGLDEDLGQPSPTTPEEAVKAAMKRPLAYKPGSEARYGFTDFTILRAILEKVSGKTLPEIFRDEITVPLGMSATGFAMASEDGPVRTGEILPHRASIYGWNGDRQRTSEFFFGALGYGAGGLYSSARDLARFCAALDRGELISTASMAELTTPATLPNGTKAGFGIGWTVRTYRNVPVVGHSGGPGLADILRIPSRGLSIVVLTNQQNFYPLLAERIADLYLPEPATQAARDRSPALTGRFRAALETIDPATEAKGSDALAPLRSPFGQAYLVGVGPIQSLAFLAERKLGDGLERRYLVRFKRKTVEFTAVTDRDGLLRSLHPS